MNGSSTSPPTRCQRRERTRCDHWPTEGPELRRRARCRVSRPCVPADSLPARTVDRRFVRLLGRTDGDHHDPCGLDRSRGREQRWSHRPRAALPRGKPLAGVVGHQSRAAFPRSVAWTVTSTGDVDAIGLGDVDHDVRARSTWTSPRNGSHHRQGRRHSGTSFVTSDHRNSTPNGGARRWEWLSTLTARLT